MPTPRLKRESWQLETQTHRAAARICTRSQYSTRTHCPTAPARMMQSLQPLTSTKEAGTMQ